MKIVHIWFRSLVNRYSVNRPCELALFDTFCRRRYPMIYSLKLLLWKVFGSKVVVMHVVVNKGY